MPAQRATLTVFDRVFAALAVRDDLARGESYCLAEVRRVGRPPTIWKKAKSSSPSWTKSSRAQTVHDALEATELVLLSLLQCPSANPIVASHLVEAAPVGGRAARVGLFHFDAAEHDGRVSFTYRCSPGVSTQRLGMRLLESEGVAASLRRLAGGDAGGDRLSIA